MRASFIFGLVLPLSAFITGAAIAGDEPYGPYNLDGGRISCKSPSGDEIRKFQSYNTTADRFFKEGSIAIRKISGDAPKSNKCEITNIVRKTIRLHSEAGDVDVSVIKSFEAFAGADCGTDIGNFAGKTANIECEVSAVVTKYNNQ